MIIFGIEISSTVLLIIAGIFILVFIICLAIANFAGENLLAVYQKYENRIVGFSNTMDLAETISQNEFKGKVKCQVISGFLGDNYCNGVISLSKEVATASNVSAFAVCSHELGHAMQYRDTPQKMKSFVRKMVVSHAVSKITLPLFVIGAIFVFIDLALAFAMLGLSALTFIVGLLVKLDTIKIESEASENALKLLKKYADFDEEDIRCAKKVLNAAKLTYIASFLKSVLAWTMLVRKYDFY